MHNWLTLKFQAYLLVSRTHRFVGDPVHFWFATQASWKIQKCVFIRELVLQTNANQAWITGSGEIEVGSGEIQICSAYTGTGFANERKPTQACVKLGNMAGV